MGALADAYAILKQGTLWSSTGRCKGYGASDPGEAAKIDAYVAALDMGQSPAPPQLATDTGKGLVGMLAALAPSPAPAPTPAASATPVPAGTILFQEDFAVALDPKKWDVKSRTANLSKTIFTPNNVSVHDGLLDIVATKDSSGQWYGGEIQTLAPTYQYTGRRYMEARAKLPSGYGTWPAPIWEVDAPWGSAGVENDVCEQLGREPTQYHATIHNWGTNESVGKALTAPVTLAGGDWHTYGCAVYDDRIDYYLDGAKTASIPSTALSVWKFTTTPMVLLVDLDMGGSWAGAPTIAGPVHLLVDYVKVWALA